VPGTRTRPDELEQISGRCECSLTAEPAHRGSGARRCGIRAADQSDQHRPARNGSRIASVACAHRAQMTSRSNVVRAAICGVFPTF